MGLPQELVDHIVDTLHEDLPALKACSLTCKAMFASTRHLIHQTLCLTPRNNERVLTREEEEKLRRLKQGYQDVQLRFLSYAGERGLLQYTRKIYISRCFHRVAIPAGAFTPDTLLPHIHHFRSLDRVHAIAVEWYDAEMWEGHFERYFAHFYPTLTSLTLRLPFGHYQSILQFALQFPNLENLSLEWPYGEGRSTRAPAAPTVVDRASLIRGRLRLANIDDAPRSWSPMEFAHELRNGFNFRSVELDGTSGSRGQRVLNAYADTIQDLTVISSQLGTHYPGPPRWVERDV